MQREELNKLVKATTAMGNWSRLVGAMADGYVPTIKQDTRRKRILTKMLAASGWQVFTG